MKIDIWSDIRCPFCYIGKRNFEAALAKFPHKEQITVNWKSFELDPNIQTQPHTDYIEYFMESKGVGQERALDRIDTVTHIASDAGLNFNLQKIKIANSLKAHRLLHYAKQFNKAAVLKEALLKAYLEDGKNIDDIDVLVSLAAEQGLEKNLVKAMLASEDYTNAVRQDQLNGRKLGVTGVPFFVLDSTYGISGAQPQSVFTEALESAWKQHQPEKITLLDTENQNTCDLDGNCH